MPSRGKVTPIRKGFGAHKAQKLSDEHKEYLDARGIDEVYRSYALYTSVGRKMKIPYFGVSGQRVKGFHRYRNFGSDDKHKFTQPRGSGCHFYFAPLAPDSESTWEDVCTDCQQPIFITEGEIKAAALAKHSIPCIGIGGVFNWRKDKVPISDFDLIEWVGRRVSLAFDADAETNPNVQKALVALASHLLDLGATVQIVLIPDLGDGKTGVDDFVVTKGIERFLELDAKEFPGPHFDSWTIDPDIEEMNEKHAIVLLDGRAAVMTTGDDENYPGYKKFDLSKTSDLRLWYQNKSVIVAYDEDGGPILENIAKYWLNHADRQQYSSVVFAPDSEPGGNQETFTFNMWQGIAFSPRRGKWNLLREHIVKNIARGNRDHAMWILGWMAHAVQEPEELPGTAIALKGPQGCGKGVFANTFCKLFGPHAIHVSDPAHLIGQFNAHLKDKLVVFADEAFYGGDKRHAGILKALITERMRMIEPKGINAFTVRNYCRLILATNEDRVVPAGPDERRFAVFDVSSEHAQDHGYFAAIADQLEDGGNEALLYYLLNFDLSRVDVGTIPRTDALLAQKIQSWDTATHFWYERLRAGYIKSAEGDWNDQGSSGGYRVRRSNLMNQLMDYGDYDKRRQAETSLGMRLPKLCTEMSTVRIPHSQSGRRERWYTFPPISECRRLFEQHIRMELEWNSGKLK
jgi:hypothetical protein